MNERDGDPAGEPGRPGAGPPSTWPHEPGEAELPVAGPGLGEPPGTRPGDAGPHRPSTTRRFLTLAVALVLLVTTALGLVLGHFVWTSRISLAPSQDLPSGATPFGPGSNSSSGQSSFAEGAPANAAALAKAVVPDLVDINTAISYQTLEGAGTGMVLTSDGEILTNNHVIEGATTISVTDIGNGRTYRADVVGYDRSVDVAVLRLVGASGLKTVATGTSATAAAGEGVVAVGNAYGSGSTTTFAAGKITALHQSITADDSATGTTEQLSGLMETNAAIVPGDSGGALVDSAGRVVGMVTAGSGSFRFPSSAPSGYAVPIDAALSVASRISAGRSSATVHVGPTPFLGVLVQSSGSAAAGAAIAEIVSGGPAASAGLQPGDVITGIDSQGVASPEELTAALLRFRPGATIRVHYLSSSAKAETTTVQLASGPPQ